MSLLGAATRERRLIPVLVKATRAVCSSRAVAGVLQQSGREVVGEAKLEEGNGFKQQTRNISSSKANRSSGPQFTCTLWSMAEMNQLAERHKNCLHDDFKYEPAAAPRQYDAVAAASSVQMAAATPAHNSPAFLHLNDQRVLGVVHENKDADILHMAHNHTAPKLAQALREREETLRILAGLLHPDEESATDEVEEELNRVLHPFMPHNIIERRRGGVGDILPITVL